MTGVKSQNTVSVQEIMTGNKPKYLVFILKTIDFKFNFILKQGESVLTNGDKKKKNYLKFIIYFGSSHIVGEEKAFFNPLRVPGWV